MNRRLFRGSCRRTSERAGHETEAHLQKSCKDLVGIFTAIAFTRRLRSSVSSTVLRTWSSRRLRVRSWNRVQLWRIRSSLVAWQRKRSKKLQVMPETDMLPANISKPTFAHSIRQCFPGCASHWPRTGPDLPAMLVQHHQRPDPNKVQVNKTTSLRNCQLPENHPLTVSQRFVKTQRIALRKLTRQRNVYKKDEGGGGRFTVSVM